MQSRSKYQVKQQQQFALLSLFCEVFSLQEIASSCELTFLQFRANKYSQKYDDGDD